MKCLLALPVLSLVASPAAAQGPPGLPQEIDTRGVVVREEGALEGYTLIAPLASKGDDCETLLIDLAGRVVHRWVTPEATECGMLLENGNLLRWGITPEENPRFQGPGVDGGLIEELTWEGEVIWRYVLDDDHQLMHHDIARLPSGNVLFLAWEHREREDAIAQGRDPEHVGEAGMWPDAVYEIRPTPPEGAEVVWEWHVWDHLVQDFDESKANHGSVPDEPGKVDLNGDHRGLPPLTAEQIAEQEEIERQMAALGYGGADEDDEGDEGENGDHGLSEPGTHPDWLHTNAIDYHPGHDLIVLSTPVLNELWVIDHSTTTEEAAGARGGRRGRGGEILWRWGNPRVYGAGGDGDQRLSFQHDPTWLEGAEPGELRLLVFNNGRVRPGSDESWSSADELALPFDPEGGFRRAGHEPFGPAEPAWSYSDPGTLYSSFISGAQRLANGNTLICSGAQGRVLEVTPDGRIVWDFRNPFEGNYEGIPANSLYRAVRIPADYPGFRGRTLSAK